jgi:hypothetical protein
MIVDAIIKLISLLSVIYTWEWGSITGSEVSRTDWGLPSDAHELIVRIKLHRLLFNQLHLDTFAKMGEDSRHRMQDVLNNMEDMYPINKDIYPSIWDLYSSFQGRGIVMAAGKAHFKYN